MNNKKIAKKLLTKDTFIETQIWIYSSFAAISLAFFLALLGVNSDIYKQNITHIAIYSFSISLITNGFIVFVFSIFRDDGDLIYNLNLNSKINYIVWCAWDSFILSVVLIVGVFSIFMICVIIIFGGFLYFVFNIVMREIKDKVKEEHKIEMERIKKGEIDE